MVLSNAERQALYRKRLKERASLDALGDQARRAADRAVDALWSFYSRPSPSGSEWGDLDGIADKEALRGALLKGGHLTDWCRDVLRGAEEDGATPDEITAWRSVVEAADALALKHAANSA